MDHQFDLFNRTIIRLGESGVLSDMILIGSWCLYFYRIEFDNANEIPLIRTLDLDFLIYNPPKIKHKVDVSELLSELGFIEEFGLLGGHSKFIHPDLEVEFVFPEKGRGKEGPYKIKEININAQGLRFVQMLQEHTIQIPYNDFKVTVPEPGAFMLHKFHISRRRTKKGKREKDIETAIELGEFLLTMNSQVSKIKMIFDDLPAKWQKEILKIIQEHSNKIYNVLS